MPSPAADVTERGIKAFMNTMKEVGTDKAVSEALIGGAAGVGANMAYNVASGDSGGYMGAGLLGGAVGGLGRTSLKHFNLEGQAGKLFSTFKEGAVGSLTSVKEMASGANSGPIGKRIMYGTEEAPIKDYIKKQAAKNRAADDMLSKGYDTQADALRSEADALGVRLKEKQTNQYKQYKNKMTPSELEDKYQSQGGAKYIKDNLDPEFRSTADIKQKDLDNIKSMGKSQTPLLGYDPNHNGMSDIAIPMGQAKKDVLDKTNHSKFDNGPGVSKRQDTRYQKPVMRSADADTGQFSFNLGSAGTNKAPKSIARVPQQQGLDFSSGQQNSFDFGPRVGDQMGLDLEGLGTTVPSVTKTLNSNPTNISNKQPLSKNQIKKKKRNKKKKK